MTAVNSKSDDPKPRQKLVIGSQTQFASIGGMPELLEIDQEIGRPHMTKPLMWNSQAWSRRLEIPWVIGEIGQLEGVSILDVGSGMSSMPIYLARHGAKVISVDPEIPAGLPDGVRRIRAAVPLLPFKDDTFDVVCCVSVLEHIPGDVTVMFKELCRVARRSVMVTFDVALNLLSTGGLSAVELRAFARSVGTKLEFPPDILVPVGPEKARVSGVAVCLMRVDETDGRWAVPRLNGIRSLLVQLHRRAMGWVGVARRAREKGRKKIRKI